MIEVDISMMKNLKHVSLPNVDLKSSIYELPFLESLEVEHWNFKFDKNLESLKSLQVRGDSTVSGIEHLILLEKLEYISDAALRMELIEPIGNLVLYLSVLTETTIANLMAFLVYNI